MELSDHQLSNISTTRIGKLAVEEIRILRASVECLTQEHDAALRVVEAAETLCGLREFGLDDRDLDKLRDSISAFRKLEGEAAVAKTCNL